MGLYANRALLELICRAGEKLKMKKDRKRDEQKEKDKTDLAKGVSGGKKGC